MTKARVNADNASADIQGVTAGTGLTGGGTSGTVTLTNDMATAIDAKGDLVVGTGADTYDNLAAGANGETLVADSSTSTGLRWQGDYAAGKNKIINGDFSVNQRNFSSSTTSAEYNLDRWRTIYTGGTSTTSAQVFTPGTAPVAGYEGKNYYRVVITGQSTTTDFVRMQEQVESVRTFAGQTTTYSFWAKADTGTPKVAVISVQGFGGGGSPSAGVTTEHGTVTLSTSWARYSVTCVIPAITGKTLGTAGDDAISVRLLMSAGTGVTGNQSIGVQNYTFETWGHQWEAGSVATAFQTATGTIQGELAACQRYYLTSGTSIYSANVTSGSTYATNYFLPVQMRTSPTVTPSIVANSGFPATNPTASLISALGGYMTAVSNATTTAGYYSFTFTASAEL